MEVIIVMAFARLGSGNSLQMCGEVYAVAESTTSIIVKEFCVTIRKSFKSLMIFKLTRNKIKKITIGFECLHGILYILGAINGNHVLVIAPKVDPKSYYCQKGFYSTLIQGVVDAKCSFWDYDYGWASSIHDWALFQKIELGNRMMKDKFLLYKLIGDVVYLIRPWFYSPFKGEKNGLPRYKTHWNFIQSSTRMSIERTFGMLKGRFKILLKRINIPFNTLFKI
jgi:hypothetical protein